MRAGPTRRLCVSECVRVILAASGVSEFSFFPSHQTRHNCFIPHSPRAPIPDAERNRQGGGVGWERRRARKKETKGSSGGIFRRRCVSLSPSPWASHISIPTLNVLCGSSCCCCCCCLGGGHSLGPRCSSRKRNLGLLYSFCSDVLGALGVARIAIERVRWEVPDRRESGRGPRSIYDGSIGGRDASSSH